MAGPTRDAVPSDISEWPFGDWKSSSSGRVVILARGSRSEFEFESLASLAALAAFAALAALAALSARLGEERGDSDDLLLRAVVVLGLCIGHSADASKTATKGGFWRARRWIGDVMGA